MHYIEPYYKWRDYYVASEDKRSPFYKRRYSEFEFSNAIYNYYIHPQWDYFGSETLYMKVIFADYARNFAVIEFIGEWNDCISNDIMLLKRNIIDKMLKRGIYKFLIIGENVLNFHADEDCYYEEWYEEVTEQEGWIVAIQFRPHIITEMQGGNLHYFLNFGEAFDQINWRSLQPLHLLFAVEHLLHKSLGLLPPGQSKV
ncbi:hypothetical protein C7N43_14965 [Sphingobacteriales bacterium UPWRP_1]|nr:hypothetical protein BVG80_04830 [Sphingobacteriales bacterium TSM_CSM]PSJ76214.1 hypothetical protein C7N43_14965 [Sphingobacteriales bacterium UPWRP_1]